MSELAMNTFRLPENTHLQVVQSATVHGPARIRGVVSATQLERQLGEIVL